MAAVGQLQQSHCLACKDQVVRNAQRLPRVQPLSERLHASRKAQPRKGALRRVVLPSCVCQKVKRFTDGRAGRQQHATVSTSVCAASAVLDSPANLQVPKDVSQMFSKLQNGSDIRGIAIAGLPL